MTSGKDWHVAPRDFFSVISFLLQWVVCSFASGSTFSVFLLRGFLRSSKGVSVPRRCLFSLVQRSGTVDACGFFFCRLFSSGMLVTDWLWFQSHRCQEKRTAGLHVDFRDPRFGRDAVVLGEGSGKHALEGKYENVNYVIHKLGEQAEDLGKAHSQARSLWCVVPAACRREDVAFAASPGFCLVSSRKFAGTDTQAEGRSQRSAVGPSTDEVPHRKPSSILFKQLAKVFSLSLQCDGRRWTGEA